MEKNEESFEYTYSAKKQEEIEKIRQKYLPKQDTELEQLRKLDQQVTKKGTMYSIVIGIIGTLIFGAGMSMVLVWTDTLLLAGVVIGVIGFAMLGTAYPVYMKITEKEREKIAPQILELTDRLLHK